MIPKFRVWLPDPDVERMLRVKALVFEHDKTRCVCGYAYDFYLEDEDATIMQSTGLLDKNGKEIFGGDILQIDYIKAIVRFGQYRYYETVGKDVLTGNGFYLECLNVMDPDCISPYETDILHKAEVIGNIYENPEYDQNFVGFRIKGK